MAKESTRKTTARNVQEALDNSFTQDDFQILLQLMARFPHYSARNILILKVRCPHAQMLKKFRTWLRFGRVVREHETAIRICAFFGETDDDLQDKKQEDDDGEFRYIPLFDISQTEELEDFPNPMPYQPLHMARYNNAVPINQDVPGFAGLMTVLQAVSPLPIYFSPDIEHDGVNTYSEITIRAGISQLRAVRATLCQIVHALIHTRAGDREMMLAEADSVAYVVCKWLGLDVALFNFPYIRSLGQDREDDEKKAFLQTVQKTSMFLIDTIEGEKQARQIGFNTEQLNLLLSPKTAARLFREGQPLFLVDADSLALTVVTNKKQLEKHDGPFAVDRAVWYNTRRQAA